jgi:eukaryotic translation initiation factor 2C
MDIIYNTQTEEIIVRYPLLPCLQVAPKEKNRFLPIEVCRITPGQRCVKKLTEQQTAQMIRQTARSASEREREIKQIVRKVLSNPSHIFTAVWLDF